MTHRRLSGAIAVVAVASVACTSSDEPAAPSVPTPTDATTPNDTEPLATTPGTTPPDDTEPPTNEPAATTDTTTADTTPATTTPAETTTAPETTTARERARRLPEELGPLVDADYDDLPDALRQPGEFVEVFDNTLVYLPDSTDLDNLNNQRPPDDDLDIIAAYAEANGALASQDTQFPVAIEPNERVQAAFVDGGQAYSEGGFLARKPRRHLRRGSHGNDPTVYRPYVLTSPRTEDTAVVFDCKFTCHSAMLFEDGTPAIKTRQLPRSFRVRFTSNTREEWMASGSSTRSPFRRRACVE